MKKTNQNGFTLVELVVVIAIIGILAAILIPTMMSYVKKAKQRAMIAEAKILVDAATTSLTDAVAEGKTLYLNKSYGANTVGCITNFMFSRVTHNVVIGESESNHVDYLVAKDMLQAIDSEDFNQALYRFNDSNERNPLNMNCIQFYNMYNSPGLVLCYNPDGSVNYLEYYNKGMLVRYSGGNYTVNTASNAKFSNVVYH